VDRSNSQAYPLAKKRRPPGRENGGSQHEGRRTRRIGFGCRLVLRRGGPGRGGNLGNAVGLAAVVPCPQEDRRTPKGNMIYRFIP
jgi:hypothetical protein